VVAGTGLRKWAARAGRGVVSRKNAVSTFGAWRLLASTAERASRRMVRAMRRGGCVVRRRASAMCFLEMVSIGYLT
jgi:hypothetical protein